MNIVIDTNVLLSALLTPDNKSYAILERVIDGTFTLFYNEVIINEYKEVLSRKKFNINKTKIGYIISFIRLKGIYMLKCSKSDIDFIDESDRIFYDIAMQSDSILITGNVKYFPKHKHITSVSDFYEQFLL